MAQTAPDPAQTARKALDDLLAQKYSELFQSFTPELQKQLPAAQLAKIGDSLKALGAPQIGEPAVRPGSNPVVTIPIQFPSQQVNAMFAVNGSGQIDRMFITRAAADIPWQHPPYAKLDSFHEKPVTVGNDEWKLPGTLTLPNGNGPFPGIVLVHASGPADRDETIGHTKIFRDLAEGLASRGVAVLRYEKRTRQYAARVKDMTDFTVEEETVEDAVRAADLLRAQPEVDPKRVYALGHALGGYVGPRIAEEDGKLAGLIIFAGNVRPLEDLLVDQAEYLGTSPARLAEIKELVARIKKLEPADEDAPPILNMQVSYLLDLKGYDPTAKAKGLQIRMLILQGERDFQVTMKDFDLWKAALGSRKDVTLKSYPALNHLFIAGEGKSTEEEYLKPGHVAPEVIEDIAKWVSQ